MMKTADGIEAIEDLQFGRWLRDVKSFWLNRVASAKDAQIHCEVGKLRYVAGLFRSITKQWVCPRTVPNRCYQRIDVQVPLGMPYVFQRELSRSTAAVSHAENVRA